MPAQAGWPEKGRFLLAVARSVHSHKRPPFIRTKELRRKAATAISVGKHLAGGRRPSPALREKCARLANWLRAAEEHDVETDSTIMTGMMLAGGTVARIYGELPDRLDEVACSNDLRAQEAIDLLKVLASAIDAGIDAFSEQFPDEHARRGYKANQSDLESVVHSVAQSFMRLPGASGRVTRRSKLFSICCAVLDEVGHHGITDPYKLVRGVLGAQFCPSK